MAPAVFQHPDARPPGGPLIATKSVPDLRIEVPIEEELLAACEYALEWFEDWSKHADHEHAFGGEAQVMRKLRRAIAEVWIREEL